MFKLVVLSAFLALASAKPSLVTVEGPALSLTPVLKTAIVHEPALAKVGEYVERVPTSISHQSSTIVHDRANVVTPIVAPALKTRLAPVVSSFADPFVRSYAAYPAAYQYPQYPFRIYYGTPYTLDGYRRDQLYKTLF